MANDVSIIIPNYNGFKYFDSIKSCLKIYYNNNIELILVDDGSATEDNTVAEFKKQFPKSICLQQKNKGLAAARNAGAKAATGEYLQFLDIDDKISPDKLEAQLKFARSNNLDVIYSDWQMVIVESGTSTFEDIAYSGIQEDMLFSLIKGWWQPFHSYLIKKEAYVNIGGSNEELVNAQDFELVARLAANGYKFGYLPGNYSLYFRYKDTSSLARGSRKIYWESYDQSLELLYRLADKHQLLSEKIKRAFAIRWFYVARNVYKFDRHWNKQLINKITRISPNFLPDQDSTIFKFTYSLFGYYTAESMADLIQKFKRQTLGNRLPSE